MSDDAPSPVTEAMQAAAAAHHIQWKPSPLCPHADETPDADCAMCEWKQRAHANKEWMRNALLELMMCNVPRTREKPAD